MSSNTEAIEQEKHRSTITLSKGNVEISDSNTRRIENLQRQLEEEKEKSKNLHLKCCDLEQERDELKKANDKLNTQHNKTIHDLKRSSGITADQILKDENNILREQVDRLKVENTSLHSEIDRLQSSLSKCAGDKMTTGNPFITDLSNPQRPQKLAEKFNSLYDNTWTDAFEIVKTKDKDEKRVCQELIEIFQKCWVFCCEVATQQQEELHHVLMTLPKVDKDRRTESKSKEDSLINNNTTSNVKDTMKCFAPYFLPALCQFYRKTIPGLAEGLVPYVDACIELCWYGTITDPSLHYDFEANNLDDFRGYTQTGDDIDYVVWPALYLYEYGPLLYKGVVQFRTKNK